MIHLVESYPNAFLIRGGAALSVPVDLFDGFGGHIAPAQSGYISENGWTFG